VARIRPSWTPPNTGGPSEQNLGFDFTADIGITANGAWWYQDGASPPTTVRAILWLTGTQALLADSGTVSTTGYTAPGWNFIPFSSGYACGASTTYTVSVYGIGNYKYSTTDLSSDIVDGSGHVTALAHTGRFINTSGAVFPSSTWDGMFGTDLDFTLGADIPNSPQRAIIVRDPGKAWWQQRDRRDANTVATAANPLPSPLDVAFGAGGPIWWQRGGAVDAAPRTWTAQQRPASDPSLLAPAAAAPPAPALRTVQGRDYGEAQWLQLPRRDQITTALLENELLGGAETITRVTSPVTNAPRWWMPQQPKRDATTPGLLDTAELEGPLLAGDLRRHGHAAIYTDRREVPQQPARLAFAGDVLADPLALTGDRWFRRLLPATHSNRRQTVPQRIALVFVGTEAPPVVKATSTSSVTAGHASTSAVTAGRTSTAAVTARRTSTGDVT
jgi:hypothetical protein